MDEEQDMAQGTENQGDPTLSQPPQEVVAQPLTPEQSFVESLGDVPPDVRERMASVWRDQNAAFTKKTQELAAQKRLLESVLNDPQKMAALQQLNGHAPQQQESQPQQEQAPAFNYREALDEPSIQAVQAIAMEAIQNTLQQVSPNIDKMQGIIDRLEKERASSEWDKVTAKYPAAKSIEADPEKALQMQQLVQGGLTVEQAVMALAGTDILSQQTRALQAKPQATQEPALERQQRAPLARQSAPVSNVKSIGDMKTMLAEAFRSRQQMGG